LSFGAEELISMLLLVLGGMDRIGTACIVLIELQNTTQACKIQKQEKEILESSQMRDFGYIF